MLQKKTLPCILVLLKNVAGMRAEGREDLCSVALRELQEETGVQHATFLAEADEDETLIVNKDENQAVKWWSFEEVLSVSNEPWMVERVYQKLVEKSRG